MSRQILIDAPGASGLYDVFSLGAHRVGDRRQSDTIR